MKALVRELIQRFPVVRCEYTDRDVPLTSSGRLYIYTGNSEKTIYPAPEINWRFRAHHDMVHRKLRRGFSFEEEKLVTQEGILVLGLQCSPQLADVYWADNVGQQEYYRLHDAFPNNQQQFVIDYIQGESIWKNREY